MIFKSKISGASAYPFLHTCPTNWWGKCVKKNAQKLYFSPVHIFPHLGAQKVAHLAHKKLRIWRTN